jgi:hypothetical protein
VSSPYEAAKPTTGLDLTTIADATLAAVVAFFATAGVDLPTRQYVTVGDPSEVAWDCEQLVVCLADVGWGRSADATQLSPKFGKEASVNAMRHATYAVSLVRAAPTITDQGELPTADALAASGHALLTDAGLLSQCLVNFVAFRNDALPQGGSAQAGAVQAAGPQGGLVALTGGLILTAGQLTDPPAQVPAGLAIVNGAGKVLG